jgi:arylsulfatase A-like enzyme
MVSLLREMKRRNGSRTLRVLWLGASLLCSTAFSSSARHNLIFVIPDGLRASVVDRETAPTLTQLRETGIDFKNSHSLFPTFTTANASAFATGHELGDTGDFSNTVYTGYPVVHANGSNTPFLENDAVLEELNEHYGRTFLNEESILRMARGAGYRTVAVGKLGPVAIQDLAATDGASTLIVDDSTGSSGAIAIPPEWSSRFLAAGLDMTTPTRGFAPGENGNSGDATHPGTLIPNLRQQQYFVDVITKVALPEFARTHESFVLVFWSRDPDGTQHNHGDRPGELEPGINGPTSLAAIRNFDGNLKTIEEALAALGLDRTTDMVIAADHGFSTIAKSSASSVAAHLSYADVAPKELPPGFLAIDLASGLRSMDAALRLYDPDSSNAPVDFEKGAHPKYGNGLIGDEPAVPDVVVAANGGSDLIYLPNAKAWTLARRVVDVLLQQDYVSGLFVDDHLGPIAGTLPLSSIHLEGSAVTPEPAIVVNFRSFSTGCELAPKCAAEIADTKLQQGQGMHGSFSRADTWNLMVARGPDFRSRYVDTMPTSNADIGATLAHLLGLEPDLKGCRIGRVLSEALAHGVAPRAAEERVLRSAPAANGLRTVVKIQQVGQLQYFDAGGFEGRSVGLDAH